MNAVCLENKICLTMVLARLPPSLTAATLSSLSKSSTPRSLPGTPAGASFLRAADLGKIGMTPSLPEDLIRTVSEPSPRSSCVASLSGTQAALY